MPRINSTFTSVIRSPRGASLLDYLCARFPYHSRAEWSDLLRGGRLELEGRTAAAGDPLREGQSLLFRVVDYDEPEVPLDYSILSRFASPAHGSGDDLAFLHKPAGMPVHRTGRIFFNTLANLAKEALGDGAWAPLNRLDRETSGIVAFARGPMAFKALAPDSASAQWTKVYAAVVAGRLPSGIGRIDQPLGELPGDPIRSRMHVREGGKRSVSLYATVDSRDGISLVALSPLTGRKHQLRAHLAWAGCPVVGDKMYSGDGAAYLARLGRELEDEDYRMLGAKRQQLHACYLGIAPAGRERAEVLDLEPRSLEHALYSAEAFREWWSGADGLEFLAAAAEARMR